MNRLSLFDSAQAAPASHRQNLSHNGLVNPTHEPRPLTPSLSPAGGEGVRRTGEGDRHWIMVPMRGIKLVVATHEPEWRAGFPACRFSGLSSPVDQERATGKSPEPAGSKACATSQSRFMVRM